MMTTLIFLVKFQGSRLKCLHKYGRLSLNTLTLNFITEAIRTHFAAAKANIILVYIQYVRKNLYRIGNILPSNHHI